MAAISPAGLHLVILAGDAGLPAREQLVGTLRVDENLEPLLAHGIEGDDLDTPLHRILKGVQEAWAVRTRVLAEKEHRIADLEVVVDDGPDGRADDLLQADGGGLMAHVGAVGQIVMPI